MNVELFFYNVPLMDANFIVERCKWEGFKVVIAGHDSEELTVVLQVFVPTCQFADVVKIFKRFDNYFNDTNETDE
ncbi:hypothetical protein ELBI_86 [Anabaena phage Elbi]|nr:hypothetical protein ELBI_86 [Anabaena phage Elbi]